MRTPEISGVAATPHRDEIVWSKDDISRAGGIGIVEAMRRGARGYADGGLVGPERFTMPRVGASVMTAPAFAPAINFIDQRPAGSPDVDVTTQRRPDGGTDVIIRQVEAALARRAARGQGPLRDAAGGIQYRQG